MVCPKCGCDTYVIETRERADKRIKRRRGCCSCSYRFTTVEIGVDELADEHKQSSYEYCFLHEEYTNQNCKLCPYRKRCLSE